MLFNSLSFLIFLPIVVLIYFVIPDRVKHLWLLAASYYFYMCWNAAYALLILFSTVVTYSSGLLLQRCGDSDAPEEKKTRARKWVVAASLILNLGILFYFKYMNFAVNMATAVLGKLHIALHIPAVDVLLPVGISFYTFQALSYTMDVYRGQIRAERDFFRYALFVSFFPQLVAGPIERSGNLLKQLRTPARFSAQRTVEGILLMLWGFFLKIVLADRIALLVDNVYHGFREYTGWYLIVATVLFAVQIYCDFAGYSTIAMGSAKILGITLMDNFDTPYLSASVSEFWRRWHISLTSWFKDYLYIPLGGSRKGRLRKYVNKMIVFLVSGLWHGASVSMVVWGGLNGLYQVLGEVLSPVRDRLVKLLGLRRESLGHRLGQTVCTFLLVDFSWIFFRADRLSSALAIVRSVLTAANPWVLFDGSLYTLGLDQKNFTVMLLSIGLLFVADLCKRRGIRIRQVVMAQDWWFRWSFIALSVIALLVFGLWGPAFDQASFIYFQF